MSKHADPGSGALVLAELRKLTTTRAWLVLLLCASGLTVVNLAISAVFAQWHPPGVPPPPGIDSPTAVRSLFASVTGGTVCATLLGLLAVTSEFRHRTIDWTFLGAPRRGSVVAAKLAAALLAGAALGLAVDLVGVAAAEVAFAVSGAGPLSPLAHGSGGILAGAVLSYALHAAVGVGLGWLVRNQVVAVLAVLVWTQAVEGTVVALLPEIGRWLLTGAGSALTRYGEATNLPMFDAWAGAALLLGYAAVANGLGYFAAVRRDPW